jgi:hypothetical protein
MYTKGDILGIDFRSIVYAAEGVIDVYEELFCFAGSMLHSCRS